jgi:hypothetical protein
MTSDRERVMWIIHEVASIGDDEAATSLNDMSEMWYNILGEAADKVLALLAPQQEEPRSSDGKYTESELREFLLQADGPRLGEQIRYAMRELEKIEAARAPQQDVDPFDLTSHSDEMCVCGKTHKECDEATPPPTRAPQQEQEPEAQDNGCARSIRKSSVSTKGGKGVSKHLEALELAWGLIANAYGGNWKLASPEWRGAAERWRDEHWHPVVEEQKEEGWDNRLDCPECGVEIEIRHGTPRIDPKQKWSIMLGSEGTARIAQERIRQMTEEGWTETHDDTHHGEELAWAAVIYALPRRIVERGSIQINFTHLLWPRNWSWGWFKPSRGEDPLEGRIRELEKAGALIAAEIDRLLRGVKK